VYTVPTEQCPVFLTNLEGKNGHGQDWFKNKKVKKDYIFYVERFSDLTDLKLDVYVFLWVTSIGCYS
jgi:hypothetical protein